VLTVHLVCTLQGGDGDDDEFYECETEADPKSTTGEGDEFRHAPWNQPVGRLRQCDNLVLLNSDEPLYIPVTQVRAWSSFNGFELLLKRFGGLC
jgi:hypothetical protein